MHTQNFLQHAFFNIHKIQMLILNAFLEVTQGARSYFNAVHILAVWPPITMESMRHIH